MLYGGHCKHAVSVCDDGVKAGGAKNGAAGAAAGAKIMAGSSTRRTLQTRCGRFAASSYSLIFLFGSVVPCLSVGRP